MVGWGKEGSLWATRISPYRAQMQTERPWPTLPWTELNRRLRLAFLRGAEEGSRAERGRALTADELRQVIGRYPGELVER
jgi:hypothetical protein